MSGGKGKMSGTGWHIDKKYFKNHNKHENLNKEFKSILSKCDYSVYQYASSCENFSYDMCKNG